MKDTGGKKKLKSNEDSNVINCELTHYTDIITQPFYEHNDLFTAYLYSYVNCPRFGILLPFELYPLPYKLVESLGVRDMSSEDIGIYKDF